MAVKKVVGRKAEIKKPAAKKAAVNKPAAGKAVTGAVLAEGSAISTREMIRRLRQDAEALSLSADQLLKRFHIS